MSSTNDDEVDDLSKTLLTVFERFVLVKEGFSKAVELLKRFIERQCKRRIAFEITKVHGQSNLIATRHDPWAYAECDDIPTLCCILDKSMKSIKEIGLYEYRVNGLTDARETFQKIMELLDSATGVDAVKKSLGFSEVVTMFPTVKQRRRRGPNKNPRKRKGQQLMVTPAAESSLINNLEAAVINPDIELTSTIAGGLPTKDTELPMNFENLAAKLYECTRLEQSTTTSTDNNEGLILSARPVIPHSTITDTGRMTPLDSANTTHKALHAQRNSSVDIDFDCGLAIVEEPEEIEQQSTTSVANVKQEEKIGSYFDALVRDQPESTDTEVFGESAMSILMRNIDEAEQQAAPSGIGVKRRSVDVDLSLHKRSNVNADVCDRPLVVDQNPMPKKVDMVAEDTPPIPNCQDGNQAETIALHEIFQNPMWTQNRSITTVDAPPRLNSKRRFTHGDVNINEVEQQIVPSVIGIKRRSVDEDARSYKRSNANVEVCDRPMVSFGVAAPNSMPLHVDTNVTDTRLTMNCQNANIVNHHSTAHETHQNPMSMRNRSFSTVDAHSRPNPKRRNTIQEDVEVIDLTRERNERNEIQHYQPLPQQNLYPQQLDGPQNHLFLQNRHQNWPQPQNQNPLPPSYFPPQQNLQGPQVSPYSDMYAHPRFQYPVMNSTNDRVSAPVSGIWPPTMHPYVRHPMQAQYPHPPPSQTQPQHGTQNTFQQFANHAFMISQQNQQREAVLNFHERQTLQSLARIPPHFRAQMLQMLEQQRNNGC